MTEIVKIINIYNTINCSVDIQRMKLIKGDRHSLLSGLRIIYLFNKHQLGPQSKALLSNSTPSNY